MTAREGCHIHFLHHFLPQLLFQTWRVGTCPRLLPPLSPTSLHICTQMQSQIYSHTVTNILILTEAGVDSAVLKSASIPTQKPKTPQLLRTGRHGNEMLTS